MSPEFSLEVYEFLYSAGRGIYAAQQTQVTRLLAFQGMSRWVKFDVVHPESGLGGTGIEYKYLSSLETLV